MYEEQIQQLNWYKKFAENPTESSRTELLNNLFGGIARIKAYADNFEWDDELISDIMNDNYAGAITWIEGFEDWGQLVGNSNDDEEEAFNKIVNLYGEMIYEVMNFDI